MVRFEDLNKYYGYYPTLDRGSSYQAETNLQLDYFFSNNWKYLDKRIAGLRTITESKFCDLFYSIMNLKIHYKNVLELLEKRYNFNVYAVAKDNGEKMYINPSFSKM